MVVEDEEELFIGFRIPVILSQRVALFTVACSPRPGHVHHALRLPSRTHSESDSDHSLSVQRFARFPLLNLALVLKFNAHITLEAQHKRYRCYAPTTISPL